MYTQALTLGLWVQWPGGPVYLKTYLPPKKSTGPQKTRNICVNLQFKQI